MPSVHPPPRRANSATCLRGLIDDSRRFTRARSQRSVPVSPTTGNGNSCGAGLLPDTTTGSRYLVGCADYRPIPAIQLGRIEPTETYGPSEHTLTLRGTFARNESSLRTLVGRDHPGMKANGRRPFRHPRNPAGHKSATTTRKAHTCSQR